MRQKRTSLRGIGMALFVFLLLPAQVSAEEPPALKTQKDKVSYAIGVEMAENFRRQGVEADMDLLIKGFRDGLSGKTLLLSVDDQRKAMSFFQNEVRRKQNEMRLKQAGAMKKAAEENKKAGEAFLSANMTEEGVVTRPSGLQYKILRAGDGRIPTDADTVEVQYWGTLIDGTEFDNSYKRNQPAIIKVTGVIPGWREALSLMPVGSKWQLFIPPQLAYGDRGAGARIGPNATLIFEVELVAIK